VRQATEGALVEKVATVRMAAGDRLEELELNVFVAAGGMVGSGSSLGASAVAGGMAAAAGLVGSPYVLHGTRTRLREVLERRRDRLGISFYAIPQPAMESMAPLVADLTGR
jgi:hypothetical protein